MLLVIAATLFVAESRAGEGFFLIGLGKNSCGAWTQAANNPVHRAQYESWVLGFVSGSNYQSSSAMQGMVPDVAASAVFVDEYCKRNPLHPVMAAAAALVQESGGPKAAHQQREEAAHGPEWALSDNGSDINWNEATNYCASKGSGWRLPTSAELQSLYNTAHSGVPCGAYTCKVESKFRLNGPVFWTNEREGSSAAFIVFLFNGRRFANPLGDRNDARALCVRRS